MQLNLGPPPPPPPQWATESEARRLAFVFHNTFGRLFRPNVVGGGPLPEICFPNPVRAFPVPVIPPPPIAVLVPATVPLPVLRRTRTKGQGHGPLPMPAIAQAGPSRVGAAILRQPSEQPIRTMSGSTIPLYWDDEHKIILDAVKKHVNPREVLFRRITHDCPFSGCTFTCSETYYLATHIAAIHYGRRANCRLCTKSFMRDSDRRRHYQMDHSKYLIIITIFMT